ncbi:MAG: CoA-binding protein [Balneolaceae bacterium]|nr:CoA-binding protein [Balneolaceae bacterium]
MPQLPESVERFLQGKRFAVAGVSRSGDVAANAVYKKLKNSGYEVYPVNPNADEVEGDRCYPDIASIPAKIDGVVIGTNPKVSADIVRQSAEAGISRVWFHRSNGQGSISQEAIDECGRLGIEPITGGCPLMFIEPVDVAHKCMRWWYQKKGVVPSP